MKNVLKNVDETRRFRGDQTEVFKILNEYTRCHY